jgi:CBS domain-containing protein
MHSKKIVEKFMHPLHHYDIVREEARVDQALKQLLDALQAGKMPCLVVIGADRHDHERVTGFLSSREIVFGVADHFLKGVQEVGPIFWDGLLEAEMPAAVSKRVSDIMAPVPACIGHTRDILEAIFLFNKHGVNLMPVVRCTEVIGVLHVEDILKGVVEIMPERKRQPRGKPSAQAITEK